MPKSVETEEDRTILLLRALAWICSDDRRADRLLALTGLDAGTLRDRALDPAVLNGIGNFLVAHEADLVACAEALDVLPERLAEAAQ